VGPVVAETTGKGSPTCVTEKRKRTYVRDHVDYADSSLAATIIIVIQLQHPLSSYSSHVSFILLFFFLSKSKK